MNHWLITDKGDPAARRLVDGEWPDLDNKPHYSRQTPGSTFFTRNGQNLVFITADTRAVWVTFRPTPGKAVRADKLDAWECALFRNEGPLLSSELIGEAVRCSVALWGVVPKDGFITYVKPGAVRTSRLKRRGKDFQRPPGYCYLKAGWTVVGQSRDGKPMLRAPAVTEVQDWRDWGWHGQRGGLLRRGLESGSVVTMTKKHLSPVQVANKVRGGSGEYVGRPSPLGNPYRLDSDGDRDQVCDQYEEWFQAQYAACNEAFMAELLRLLDKYVVEGQLSLLCWCAPKRCHAGTIARFIEKEAMNQGHAVDSAGVSLTSSEVEALSALFRGRCLVPVREWSTETAVLLAKLRLD